MRTHNQIMAGIIDCYRDADDLEQWAAGYATRGSNRAGSKGEVAWLLRELTNRQQRLDLFRQRDERDEFDGKGRASEET